MDGSIPPVRPREPVRLRPMAIGLLTLGVVLSGIAFALRDPVLLFLALPILSAPLAAVAMMPRGPDELRLSWRSMGTGAEVPIEGELSGADPEAARSIALEFHRPEPLEEVRAPVVERGVGPLRFRLEWLAPHPLLATVPVPTATLVDPLRLVERALPVSGDPLALERFPPEAARVGSVRLRRTTPLPGEVASRARGSSGEFFGVRYAAPGDSPRQINWRATGRLGRQCANEFLLDRTGDLLIVLDARPTALGPAYDESLLAIGRAAAHGIAQGFLKEKNRVGVAVFGEYLDGLPIGSGRTHRFRIDRLLAGAHVAQEAGPPERLAVAVRRAYPPGVSTLVISPLGDADSFEILPHLRRRGFPTFVLSPSPLPMMARWFDPGPEGRSIRRLVHLMRRAKVGRVWEDAPILDWEEYWSLAGFSGLLRVPGHPRGSR
jgi:uncharacterized protein (DUF58 family)